MLKIRITNIKFVFIVFLFSFFLNPLKAQLKFIIEDFEGFADGHSDLKINGVFTFGSISAGIDHKKILENKDKDPVYLGERYITINKLGNMDFGGWGKGINLFIEIDPTTDYFNFFAYLPSGSENSNSIRIELQDDDNDNSVYEKESDDSWIYLQKLESENISSGAGWQLISIPLSKFKDDNPGGDGVFNINYKKGKILGFSMNFYDTQQIKNKQSLSFDFFSFSKGALSKDLKPLDPTNNFCNLGYWAKVGNPKSPEYNFTDIALGFENIFKPESEKKLGVIHLFQPFALDGGNIQNHYPSVDRINKVIQQGYIPMITLESHFVNTNSKMKQPNLYSITEGYFDSFFATWATQIKQVEGTVLLRILHEFNGDWYPWCIINNDKNPELLIKAFRHIHDVFKAQKVTNVKFIWCPNSMSVPQEKWNNIMDAYPGDAYVDFVAIDIYNGAGKRFSVWRSFIKEGIENYFVLTQQLPGKPLFICETASRERESSESKLAQTKAEWIQQMGGALKSDMSKVKLLTWFNETGTFKINSTVEAKNAFLNYILNDDHFKSGTKYMFPLLKK